MGIRKHHMHPPQSSVSNAVRSLTSRMLQIISEMLLLLLLLLLPHTKIQTDMHICIRHRLLFQML